ncbi:MAG: acetate--CoA ligase family protein [Solirubrobacterales bacterium]|nr:acetate--CoA ligase family protein [Solirubrobacterales bacterium]
MTIIRPTPLLSPRSVAVVGATERPGSYGETVVRNLLEAGFPGEVFCVNPGRKTVHGHPCFPSLTELPSPADAVVVAVPAPAATPAIREAIETGCGGAVVVSAGFGETPSGEELEAELKEVAFAAGFPVCGPNGNGVISLHHRAPLWGDSVPTGIEPGPVAMISQSGNVAVNAIGSRRGIKFHTMVSTGNQAVLDTGDWLQAVAELDGVRAIALFQETDGDGAKLAEALATCAEREVGVAVLKVGTSKAGQAAAAAHTGAIAGDQKVFRALIEEAGAAWATDPHELLEIARVLAEPKARPRRYDPALAQEIENPDGTITDLLISEWHSRIPGLAILTCSGGDSGIASDQAELVGLRFAELPPETENRLKELLPEAATVGNPLDYTSLLWFETDRLTEIVETVGNCETVEQMLVFHDHPGDLRPEHESEWAVVRRALAEGARRSSCPTIFASTLPDLVSAEGRRELAEIGIPVVGGMRAAIAASTASQRAARLDRGSAPEQLRTVAAATRSASGEGSDGVGMWLAEHEAKGILREFGVAVPLSFTALTPGACLEAAAGLSFPLVLKLSGPTIQHKSELGAVRIGINDETELLRHAEDLMSIAGQLHLEQGLAGEESSAPPVFLIEEMARPGVEMIITARSDAVVPSLTVGIGGTWAEDVDDVVVVPLPTGRAEVLRAIGSLKSLGLLRPRGGGAADTRALADLAVGVGQLLTDYRDPEGRKLDLVELNPVVATSDGAIALDALAHLA